MSYILDALQKANAQRHQGAVPVLDSGVIHAGMAARQPGTGRRWIWLASCLAGGLMLTSVWWWFGRAAPATPAAASESTAVPSAVLAPAPAASSSDEQLSTLANSRVFESRGPILAAPPAAPAPAPATTSTPTPSSSAAGSPNATADAAVALASASDTAGLTVTGSTYSANPQHRMLIVNGQVVREGQELRPGLRLEVIGPRSAILDDRGRRFNLNY